MIYNPFDKDVEQERTDESLIDLALQGDREALEGLIKRHQDWVYNIALRMVWSPEDAEDVTQEVLIKIITKLSTFKGKSRFRTWAYRIVANHVINMKKRGIEKYFVSFSEYWKGIEQTPDMNLSARQYAPVDLPLIVEETKIQCMMGMLLCLNREQRLIFILGEIFGVSDTIGSEIIDISKANFRQKLSRSRKQVYNFMNEKCGLIRSSNPCHCARKTKALIDAGDIDPDNLLFNSDYIHQVKTVSSEKKERLDSFLNIRCRDLFREHPFKRSPGFLKSLQKIVSSHEFREIFDFGDFN
jgi:RNA polymerase sigma factor (sigma-70 family)